MSDAIALQDTLLPSRLLRVTASLLIAVLAGLCVSPFFNIAFIAMLIVLTALGWIATNRWKNRRGLRTNSYFPMTSQDPHAPWSSSWTSTWTGAALAILVYGALTIGTAITNTTAGWIWAAFIGTTTATTLLIWTVKKDHAPLGHTPLRSLINAKTDVPHTDADYVGMLLYAALAVPDGRQISLTGLVSAIRDCQLDRELDTVTLDSALADLHAKGFIANVIERDRSGRPITWISLTKNGANHVVELLRALGQNYGLEVREPDADLALGGLWRIGTMDDILPH